MMSGKRFTRCMSLLDLPFCAKLTVSSIAEAQQGVVSLSSRIYMLGVDMAVSGS